jgi:hypothetical protein
VVVRDNKTRSTSAPWANNKNNQLKQF